MVTNNTTQNASDNCTQELSISFLVICCLLVLLAVLIITANLIVILLVVLRKPLQSLTNVCLTSLALTDSCEGFVSIPLIIACSSTCFLEYLCLAMDLCQRFLAISTITHLLIITTERYIMIIYPMWYPRIVTKKRILLLLASTWIFSLSLSLIQLSWLDTKFQRQSQIETKLNLSYDLFCVAVIVLPLLVFMTYAHAHILVVAKRQVRSIMRQCSHFNATTRRKYRKRKGNLVYVAMIVVFVVGWIPYFLFTIEADLVHVHFGIPYWTKTVFLFLKLSASLFNPLLYTYFKSDFRREIRAAITQHALRRQVSQTLKRNTRQHYQGDGIQAESEL